MRGRNLKQSIYDLTFDKLTEWLLAQGEKKYRAEQIWDWLYGKRVSSFSEMTNLSKNCRNLLEEHFTIQSLSKVVKQESKDGTIKFLFQLYDGNLIETVLMRFSYGVSVCVTTQVGCNIGCSFCASGLLKKSRNLTSGEIIEQIIKVQQFLDEQQQMERVSHIVVMGIGEPFDNYDNVMDFLRIVNHPKGLAIGVRHITVSTSGLAHKIYDFADEDIKVNLALSLHAPNNEIRSSIMKINKAFPIEKLMDAIDYYIKKTNRRVTIEYILLKGINDQKHHAEELANLLKPRNRLTYVNLIPYNPVDEHIYYERSDKEDILAFFDTIKKNGIHCSIRWEQGADIDAACGQLRSKQMKKRSIG